MKGANISKGMTASVEKKPLPDSVVVLADPPTPGSLSDADKSHGDVKKGRSEVLQESNSNPTASKPSRKLSSATERKASVTSEDRNGSINSTTASNLVKLLADTPPNFFRSDSGSTEDGELKAALSADALDASKREYFQNIATPLSAAFEYQPQDGQSRGRPITSNRTYSSGVQGRPRAGSQRTLSSPPSIKRSRPAPRAIQIPPQPNFDKLEPITQGHLMMERRGSATLKARSPNKASPSKELGSMQFSGQAEKDAGEDGKERPGHDRHPSFPALPLHTYLSLALTSPSLGASPDLRNNYPMSTESPDIVLERLTNVFNLPFFLEESMLFGCFACLDNWLWCFTILPLRFLRAILLLIQYWWDAFSGWFKGGKRLAKRNGLPTPNLEASTEKGGDRSGDKGLKRRIAERPGGFRVADGGERGKRVVSNLQPMHKAEILRGLVVFCSCWLLMRMDASKLYHTIRGQAAIKLYVIYNVLEMADRLLAALGQDIFECLFCRDTLERKENGRSKVLRPFLFFLLALVYNVSHTGILFYQVVTLNVAVNSYSNALLTLLMSTQFVEIKATVFKKFEKESLFQLTCADIVERFQLWLMLLIIFMRNVVEMSIRSSSDPLSGLGSPSSSSGTVWPKSFTFLGGETGKLMGPFIMVLGSEMIVDWLKHAFITKFNVIRPHVYQRYLDVMCKDYYSNAFGDQNLHKRLGLPVIPLTCCFIRVTIQTFQLFLSSRPIPTPSRSVIPTTAISRLGANNATLPPPSGKFTIKALLEPLQTQTLIPTIIFIISVYFIALAIKLALGIVLLNLSRKRYKGMKEREKMEIYGRGTPVGGSGLVQVSEEKKKVFYDPGEKIPPPKKPGGRTETDLFKVERFAMVAKRIY